MDRVFVVAMQVEGVFRSRLRKYYEKQSEYLIHPLYWEDET